MTIYLGTSSSAEIDVQIRAGRLGRLCTPQGGKIPVEGTWAADSGCFTLGARFDLGRYLGWLDRMRPYADRCLFAPAPDVVADWEATLARSAPVLPLIEALGYRAALVLQDGASVDTVPWGTFGALFVGGTTEFKLGPDVRAICDVAWPDVLIHVGRVNSGRRFRYARDVLGADSADGTFLSFGPGTNLPRLLAWFDAAAS